MSAARFLYLGGVLSWLGACEGVPNTLVDNVGVDAALVATDAFQEPPPPDAGTPFACSLEDLTPVFACAFQNCQEQLGSPEFNTCVASACGPLVLQLPQPCLVCLLSALEDPAGALDVCLTNPPSGRPDAGVPSEPIGNPSSPLGR